MRKRKHGKVRFCFGCCRGWLGVSARRLSGIQWKDPYTFMRFFLFLLLPLLSSFAPPFYGVCITCVVHGRLLVSISQRALFAGVGGQRGEPPPVAPRRQRGDLQGQHPHQQTLLQRDTQVKPLPASSRSHTPSSLCLRPVALTRPVAPRAIEIRVSSLLLLRKQAPTTVKSK